MNQSEDSQLKKAEHIADKLIEAELRFDESLTKEDSNLVKEYTSECGYYRVDKPAEFFIWLGGNALWPHTVYPLFNPFIFY